MRVCIFMALLVFSLGCDVPTGLGFPAEAERITPPPVYREWWAWTQACAGLTGDFDEVSWYVVRGARRLPGSQNAIGAWYRDGNRVVIIEEAVLFGDLVRHEMLHALVRSGGHPRDSFVGRCGGIVLCEGPCQTDGGSPPQPPPDAINVSPHDIEVRVEVWPTAAGTGVPVDVFGMVIVARNPRAIPVIVELAPAGDRVPPVTYEYDVQADGFMATYAMRAEAPEVAWFAPGEEKRFIFDFHAGDETRYDMPPGLLTLRGAFGSVWAAYSPTVTLRPLDP